MNILITGGAGFIGSHLADALIKLNHNVTIIDNLSSGTKFNVPSEAEFIEADIRTSSISNIFKNHKFDLVFHEAAQTLVPESIKNPYNGINKCIGILQTNGCKKNNFFFICSGIRKQFEFTFI